MSKKIVGLVLAMLMLVMPSLEANAAGVSEIQENQSVQLNMVPVEKEMDGVQSIVSPRAMLFNCLICVNSSSSGMRLTFSTDCTQIASEIGIKDVVIKQKVWYGWKTVATSEGGYYLNGSSYSGSILYTNAIKGEEYRITCTHYADADEYTEVHGELDVIFTY